MVQLNKIELEDIDCSLGCSRNDEIVLTGNDMLHNLPGTFTVVKCRSCGLMRTNPRPTLNSIGLFYPDNYGPYIGTQVQQIKSESLIKKILRPLVRLIFNFNSMRLPAMAPSNMLEIGCASGAFLHQMREKGWKVQGIEFSQKAAQAASQLGYHVHSGPLETAPAPDEAFELIVGWMVLEHLNDPIGGLRKLREWAKPSAKLVLSVPNAGSLEFRLFKNKWYALQLPTHYHHFTPYTLEQVLSASGWKLEKIYHQRTLSNLIASLGYVLRDKGYKKIGEKLIRFPDRGGWLVYILYPMAFLFSIFGQTGRMTVWATIK